jgi:hypothetical protein
MFFRVAPYAIVGAALGATLTITFIDLVFRRRWPAWQEFVPRWTTCIGVPIGALVFFGVRRLVEKLQVPST